MAALTRLTAADVVAMVSQNMSEGPRLDFKSKASLDLSGSDKTAREGDFAKMACALANAEGGQVIYGLKEQKATDKVRRVVGWDLFPTERAQSLCEDLGRTLNAHTTPLIPGADIYSLEIEGEGGSVIVLAVPPSETAHQTDLDKHKGIYYQRGTTSIERMSHNNLLRALDRRLPPKVELVFETVGEGTQLFLRVSAVNTGSAMALYWAVRVGFIPGMVDDTLFGQRLAFQPVGTLPRHDPTWETFHYDNAVQEKLIPLFPQQVRGIGQFRLRVDITTQWRERHIQCITFADSTPVHEHYQLIGDIPAVPGRP